MAKTARRDTAVRDRADDVDDELDAPRPRKLRAGAGGRWWVGVGRVLLWAFVIVVIFNGIWFPIRNGFSLPTSAAEPEVTETVQFPETAAAAFALRFADAYLDTADPETRQAALATFVPEGQAGQLNLPADSLTGENLTVIAVEVHDEYNAVVVIRADVNGEAMSLEVPVYSDGSSLVLSGGPALLAAPARAELPAAPSFDQDPQVAEQLEGVLTGFFEAYAEEAGHLDRYVELGATVTPLPANSVEFVELSDITVPSQSSTGDDDVRQVATAVVWALPSGDAGEGTGEAGQMVQNYLVTVVNSGNEWYVRDIQGAPHSFGG
ncbi:conjugal transfer protein [Nocardiopsis valliformis]|uniref:conjugal transfer protein n=1 Tax=Nocardiopsis valliformis TaxID=239974 RepID=UPI000478155C|nr:conjugal transfer protein [Nocardiopsis valliformis]